MTITVVFDPPLPSDSPATFNTKAFSTLGDLNDWSTEANALAADVTAKQSTASTAATTATTQAGISTTKADEASASALAADASADAAAASAASVVAIEVTTHAATSKTTPVDADEIPMADSAASWGLKKLTWANLKATLKTYFDTLYLGISATAANASQLLGFTWASPGTIGSTTPNSGAFTSLSASSTVSGSGFDAYLASPPAIGGTVAAAGTFTNLTATGNAALGDAEATDTHAIKGATTVLANSANPAVKITQTGAGNAFVVEDSASTDSTPFVIDSEGRIGQAAIDTRAMHNIGQHAATGSGLQYYRAGGTHPETGTAYTITFHSEVTTPASASTFTELTAFKSQPAATGANSTITLHQGFAALGPTLGAGASITTQYGFAASGSLTAATNNYGFYGNIAAGTGRYNFYAAGDAPNRFAGETLVIGPAGLGYGTGAGGTVTQATSKSTGVTLNKPCGQITMHNAALAAGASVDFYLTNSLIGNADLVVAQAWSAPSKYEVRVLTTYASTTQLRVTNTTAGSLSEAVVINFAIIKGATF